MTICIYSSQRMKICVDCILHPKKMMLMMMWCCLQLLLCAMCCTQPNMFFSCKCCPQLKNSLKNWLQISTFFSKCMLRHRLLVYIFGILCTTEMEEDLLQQHQSNSRRNNSNVLKLANVLWLALSICLICWASVSADPPKLVSLGVTQVLLLLNL